MGLYINNNIMSNDAASNSSKLFGKMSKFVASLSSGLRINSADDDAAGMAVSELMRADIAAGGQSSRNVQDGISMAQTAEGASSIVSDNLVRMKQLATQAASGTYSPQQKSIMQKEFSQLHDEIKRISSSTEFNGVKLLDSDGSVSISTGQGDAINVDTKDLSLTSLDAVDLTADPSAAAAAVDTAISEVSEFRGTVGAEMNRLQSAGEVIDVKVQNIKASQSRIADADVAKEMASLTTNSVVSSASIAMLAQANNLPKMALKLLE
jgi:flagellin